MAAAAPVRLQFGHDHSAGSPLWCDDGLLDVTDLELQAELVSAMVAWADEVDEHCMLPDHVWIGSDQSEFERRGDLLASRLADELGNGFVIERSTGPSPRRTFRGSAPSRNPNAAAALLQVLAKDE